MLNKEGARELCYVVYIDGIEPIVGSDNCECAIVGGWHVMVRKGQFNIGDPAIYFEIDSKVPSTNSAFAFLEKRNYKVKTQKYTFGGKGNFVSQGLLMAPEDFGWERQADGSIWNPDAGDHGRYEVGTFLTKELGVTYADAEDNARKTNPNSDKYKKMTQRHPNIFRKKWARFVMKYKLGRRIMFFFFGKKKDKRGWPTWVAKTDEERVQNMPWIVNEKGPWVATEKIDGTSTTFTIKRGKHGKFDFYVCSRNVVFDKPDKKCFYDTNVYIEMAEKYNVEEVLTSIMKEHREYDWITLQGETYGAGVQKRDYGMKSHDFAGFNFITSTEGRWNSVEAEELMKQYGIPWVPIITDIFYMPDTVDELLTIATGASVIDGGIREGLVFRSQDGTKSFKAVSNEFLLKYHQ